MSQISIELLDFMGDDLTIANAARVSFDKQKDVFDEKDARLIHYLADHSHTSPFRHTCVQLRCEAPVFLARQLVKHTVGLTWNEVSRRYVDVDVQFYTPGSWRSRPTDGIKQGSGKDVIDQVPHRIAYEYLLQDCKAVYDRMIEDGVAPEMARMVLPQSMMCSWIWTGSLQAFHHVYQLRSGEGAQEEAKMFAEKLQEVVSPLFPHAWQALNDAQTN